MGFDLIIIDLNSFHFSKIVKEKESNRIFDEQLGHLLLIFWRYFIGEGFLAHFQCLDFLLILAKSYAFCYDLRTFSAWFRYAIIFLILRYIFLEVPHLEDYLGNH